MSEWLDDESCSTGGHRFIMKHETSQNSFPWSVCDSRRGNGLWLVLQMCSDWHVKVKTATLCLLRKGEWDYSGVCRKYWWKLIQQMCFHLVYAANKELRRLQRATHLLTGFRFSSILRQNFSSSCLMSTIDSAVESRQQAAWAWLRMTNSF